MKSNKSKMDVSSPEYRNLVQNLLGKDVVIKTEKQLPMIPVSSKNSPRQEQKTTKDTNTVYVVVYVLSDDSDEPLVKVFSNKKAAINYVEDEIRQMKGQEDFEIDENEEDLSWDLEYGVHWEISKQKVHDTFTRTEEDEQE
jgi:hypothetical protein